MATTPILLLVIGASAQKEECVSIAPCLSPLKEDMWCVLECVSVRMLVVRVCVCVCLQQWDKDNNYTHTHTALNLEENKITFQKCQDFMN